MKNKIILLITGILLLCSLFACSGDGGANDTDQSPEEDDSFATVRFMDNGTEIYEALKVKKGETIKRPVTPNVDGYTFVGWHDGKSLWNFYIDTVEADITLTAKRVLTEYKISYELSGGEAASELPQCYTIESEAIVLPAAVSGEHKFDGWFTAQGKKVEKIDHGSTGDLHLIAAFYDTKPEGNLPSGVRSYAIFEDETVNITTVGSFSGEVELKVDIPEEWYIIKLYSGGKYRYKTANGSKVDVSLAEGASAKISPVTLKNDKNLESDYGIRLENGKMIDVNYYPGFVRKAVTFTIDDGRVDTDTIFLDIVRPAGIIGTFNIMSANKSGLTLYEGYEIANHHKLHCLPMRDGFDYSKIEIKDEIFNRDTSDPAYIYKTTTEGLYYIDYRHYTDAYDYAYWHSIAENETYVEYIDITKAQIEEIYGEGSVVGFAYPHGQLNQYVKQYLIDAGYLYARKTGDLKDKTGFALPEDRFAWTYNASVNSLLDVMAKYDAIEDDGTLKFFAFGVHSKDFDGKWDVLREFAEKYGNRPEDFWYASNRDIFEYEDAIKALEITENEIINNSDVDVFVLIDGVKTVIEAHSKYSF